MIGQSQNDWSPETYSRFRGLRLRPAIDLLKRIGSLPEGDVIDLGCGNGAVADALASRFPDRKIIGVDRSEAMLVKASETRIYDDLVHADIAHWEPAHPPALIFSNAALNWLPEHDTLLPHLAGRLADGGVLAVQVPGQHNGPSHKLARDVAVSLFPDLFSSAGWNADVLEPEAYKTILSPFGQVDAWEESYSQRLDPVEDGHPVRHFTQSTYLRPIMAKLDDAQQRDYLSAYDKALSEAYPIEEDKGVLFPFRRVFFILEV